MLRLRHLFPQFATAGQLTVQPALHLLFTEIQLVSRENRRLYSARKREIQARKNATKINYKFDFADLKVKTGGDYTHLPLNIRRLGGRHPETGKKVNLRIGGGVKFDYFMVDTHRRGPDNPNETYDERVIEIRQDPNRTPHLALVAGTKGKRWIYATQNMEAGQIIKTTCHIPPNPIPGVEGNAYPIGALLPGTIVNTLELYPSEKAHTIMTEAGSAAEIVRHQSDFTIVRLPNKHEYALKPECMATVGALSHQDYGSKIFGSPQMHRRFGFRMTGGPYMKKDGYQGRKIRRPPPVRTYDKAPSEPLRPLFKFTLTDKQLSHHYGTAATDKLVAEFNNLFRH